MTPARHLYVHVPFCSRKCSYCDFAIAVRRQVPVRDYLDALSAELARRLSGGPDGPVTTVYFGGGTPSKLGPDGVASLLDLIREATHSGGEPGVEITLEANPEDVNRESALAWLDAGVTRLSLGAQSFEDKALAWMHRTHGAADTRRAVESARIAGFADISLDLIFALPAELGRSWAADVAEAIALGPDHLSLYGLTVEPHTPLGRWTARGDVQAAPEERYAEEFLLADRLLNAAGFEHYEVSNFARPGHRSRHNSAYWRRAPYLGVGPSAHSFDGVTRRWNEREYEAWKARVLREDPVAGDELLTPANELAETIYLGLRRVEGLRESPADAAVASPWSKAGWLKDSPGTLALTPEGWLRLDSLAAALTVARSR